MLLCNSQVNIGIHVRLQEDVNFRKGILDSPEASPPEVRDLSCRAGLGVIEPSSWPRSSQEPPS